MSTDVLLDLFPTDAQNIEGVEIEEEVEENIDDFLKKIKGPN